MAEADHEADGPTFDLQAHSTASDGDLPPAGVVHAAAAAGVETLALTDHDTVAGVAEALAAGADAGVRVIPAVEITAVDRAAGNIHVLGYLVDHEDTALGQRLSRAREDRDARAYEMARRLRAAGVAVDAATLDARRREGRALGRPHVAQAVLAAERNAGPLAAQGTSSTGEVIRRWLVPGEPAYVPRTRPSSAETIEWIHEAGGLAVWAHPFQDLPEADTVIATLERLAAGGLDGVEAFYPEHDAARARLLSAEAERLDLLTTGSADFHGPTREEFSRFRAFSLHGIEPRLGPIGEP